MIKEVRYKVHNLTSIITRTVGIKMESSLEISIILNVIQCIYSQ